MVLPWSRTLANMYRVGRQKKSEVARDVYGFSFKSISRVASFEMPIAPGSTRKSYAAKSEGQALEQLVNLLLSKWMRELEKVFYGNIVAYDTAMLPDAKPDELQNAIWKNVFSDDGSPTYDATALPAVLAFSRYVRRECTCLSLTDKESMFSGNFMFTPLENSNA